MLELTLRIAAVSCREILPLAGHLIGVTGDRRVEELAALLRSLGGTVLHGPTLHVRPISEDDGRLRTATAALIARPPDYLVATTGIGIRGWINAAATWGMANDLVAALGSTTVLARGPKVVGAIAVAGIPDPSTNPAGRTSALLATLER